MTFLFPIRTSFHMVLALVGWLSLPVSIICGTFV
jgi:hypothetical protein